MFDDPEAFAKFLAEDVRRRVEQTLAENRWYAVYYQAALNHVADGMPDTVIWQELDAYLSDDAPEPGEDVAETAYRKEIHDLARQATEDALAGRPSKTPGLFGKTVEELITGV